MIEHEDLQAKAREVVKQTDLTPDAEVFLACLYDEVNLSLTRTHKRRSDDPAVRNHDQDLAYAQVVNGMSTRRRLAIVRYARLVAFYLSDGAVK